MHVCGGEIVAIQSTITAHISGFYHINKRIDSYAILYPCPGQQNRNLHLCMYIL